MQANVSALQVRRAYERFYRRQIPGGVTYSKVASDMMRDLGEARAIELVKAESNDPATPEPAID